MAPIELPTLGYFRNGNGYLGSAGAMRFQIEKPVEGSMTAVLWQGPYSRPYAQEFSRATFDLTATGLEDLKRWLDQQAQTVADRPPFTPQETEAYYQAKKQEEQALKEKE